MALLLTLFACIFPALLACQQKPYDVVIRNGHIVDGTGSPWYAGDIAIRDGRIAAVGPVLGAKAGKTIDAHGMVVAPGFIDMLGQSDLTILVRPDLPSKIFQGITTEFTGEGSSAAPLNARSSPRIVWTTTISRSRPIGRHWASTLPGSSARRSASTWVTMWAPPRCAAW